MKHRFCFVGMSPKETKKELERNWREVIAPIIKAALERVANESRS